MIYNVYKNISNQDFNETQARLSDLNVFILQHFADKLMNSHRADETDYLALNFSFVDDDRFMGNFAIMFEDRPEKISFSITIVKAFDKDGFRYFKREMIAENISLAFLEDNIEDLSNSAVQKYYSWSEEEVSKSSIKL